MREAGLLVLGSPLAGLSPDQCVCPIASSPSFRIVCKVGGTSVGLRGKGILFSVLIRLRPGTPVDISGESKFTVLERSGIACYARDWCWFGRQ